MQSNVSENSKMTVIDKHLKWKPDNNFLDNLVV